MWRAGVCRGLPKRAASPLGPYAGEEPTDDVTHRTLAENERQRDELEALGENMLW